MPGPVLGARDNTVVVVVVVVVVVFKAKVLALMKLIL